MSEREISAINSILSIGEFEYYNNENAWESSIFVNFQIDNFKNIFENNTGQISLNSN